MSIPIGALTGRRGDRDGPGRAARGAGRLRRSAARQPLRRRTRGPRPARALAAGTAGLVLGPGPAAGRRPGQGHPPARRHRGPPVAAVRQRRHAAARRMLIVSPYFMPGDAGVAWLRGLVKRGVRVTVLTNSLAATDVGAVHAGYERYREALLEGGVRLYELRPGAIDYGRGQGQGRSARRLACFAACQDLRLRPPCRVHRLAEPRPAFGAVEHRDRRGVRQRAARRRDGQPASRRRSTSGLAARTRGASRRQGTLVWIETSAAGVRQRLDEPEVSAGAGSVSGSSACCRSSRSSSLGGRRRPHWPADAAILRLP